MPAAPTMSPVTNCGLAVGAIAAGENNACRRNLTKFFDAIAGETFAEGCLFRYIAYNHGDECKNRGSKPWKTEFNKLEFDSTFCKHGKRCFLEGIAFGGTAA